jgi:hypothetical protein
MKKFTITMIAFAISVLAMAQAPAFPGAEGYGRFATGGRGGNVIHVTNLNDTGTGSFRAAMGTTGSRIIVFDISGTIELASAIRISKGDVTVEGQTAPGDGICLKNYNTQNSADNVILRFMRFRLGDEKPDADGTIDRDAIWGRNQNNIILDHCSMSWCTDECASFYGNTNFTMQWCLLEESLRGSLHPKGYHGYGGIWGGQGASFHHNMLAHHDSRNPRMCGSRYTGRPDLEKVDLRNCVFYNWGSTNSGYAGEGGSYNFVNNYYKSGPATKSSIKYRIFQPNADDGTNSNVKGVYGHFYVNGNYMFDKGTNWDWSGINIDNSNNTAMTVASIKSDTAFTVAAVTTHSAETAFEKVLTYVGASYSRDIVDRRVMREARERSYTYKGSKLGGLGIIDSQKDVGGWPALTSKTKPIDTDNDGIPDDWETANGLNPNNAADAVLYTIDTKGYYTNIEVYCNSLVEDIMKAENTDAQTSIEEYYPTFKVPTAINDLTTTANIIDIKYYSISGQEIKNNEKGIVIKSIRLANGKVINSKISK